jgi:bacterioferritin-associated ferredoxin
VRAPAETLAPEPATPVALRCGRAMTRCECAELPFAEIERRMREEAVSFDEVARRTGCGSLCTACIPDLQQYLRSRR